MLLQALHVEIEMKNLNLQLTLLVQKSVGTRSHTKKGVGAPFPHYHTAGHATIFETRAFTLACTCLCPHEKNSMTLLPWAPSWLLQLDKKHEAKYV